MIDNANDHPSEGLEDGDDGFDDRVAVIGLAGRYPGAPDIDTFWDNLVKGVDSLHSFTDEELADLGIPESIYGRKNFVRRGTILDGYDRFDAERFGFSPREAAMTDPQARIFLETVHSAVENAGYNPFEVPGEVGVFAGCNPIDYALLLGNVDPTDSLSAFDQMIGNDRDFLATRVSHRLGFTGPALNLQSACSTSLVAVHLAAQHLIDYHCSMAIAGGVSLNFRQGVGYFYQQGMILSPDGVCRAFDNKANGTTLGQGSGAVVLKRLADAEADGDTIHAVIAASALNNDGSTKISYTAPSAEGQSEVIATALGLAGLSGHDITYVETHGTGTNLGDPVEVSGLTKAFRLTTDQDGFCALGSVKTNVGHTDAAAGVTGFIKAVLAVREGVIPASLHFDEPNAAIDFASSPFYVADQTTAWKPTTTDKRRAGISSFGIGGTNAHVIVEEPPLPISAPSTASPTTSGPKAGGPLVLVASAPTANSAKASITAVADWARNGIDTEKPPTPAHAATLLDRRRQWDHRRVVVVDPTTGFVDKPTTGQVSVPDALTDPDAQQLVWLFSGQGAQFSGMARGLHGRFDVFTETFDRIAGRFAHLDLTDLLTNEANPEADDKLKETATTQPALFAVQVAMARQLQAWGLKPRAVLGHSIGEFAAATIAGILTLDDAITAVEARGRLMQAMEPGIMLATRLPASELESWLPDGAELAASNSTASSVASGPESAIDALAASLKEAGKASQKLATSHAFHSASMQPAATAFAEVLESLTFSPPQVPMLSNVTGTWMDPSNAVDPQFWSNQIRQPVRFAECLATLASERGDSEYPEILVEIGPGRALGTFASGHDGFATKPVSVQCLGAQRDSRSGDVIALDAVGSLWTRGINPDWDAIHGSTEQYLPAPPSVMEGDVHWLPDARHVLALPIPGESTAGVPGTESSAGQPLVRLPVEQWSYGRSWRRVTAPPQPSADVSHHQRVVVLTNGSPLATDIIDRLEQSGAEVIPVALGESTNLDGSQFVLSPADDEGVAALVRRLTGVSRRPDRVIHLWLSGETPPITTVDETRAGLDLGVNTMLSLARGLAPISQDNNVHIEVITQDAHSVLGNETVSPVAAAVAGPVKVIPLEYGGITARQIDLPAEPTTADVDRLIAELTAEVDEEPINAIRAGQRWSHCVEQLKVPAQPADRADSEAENGVYVIFGGLGGVGLSVAEHLARSAGSKIVLTSRGGRPADNPDSPETTRRLERLDAITEIADGLEVVAADVTNFDDVERVFAHTESVFGPVTGVIMSAAVADTEGAIHRRSPEAAESAISAKVFGAVNVAQALMSGNRHPDYVLLSSSIASQLYHNRFGQVGYVTANSFAEAMAESGTIPADRVVTVAWDDWLDIGMSVRAAQDFSRRYGSEITLMDEIHSFAPSDGVQVFEAALSATSPTIFVSTTDLSRRIAEDRHVLSPFLTQALASDDDDASSGSGGGVEVGQAVKDSWVSLLGITEIDDDDDFFDLGGDSLQVARMADRLGRVLDTEIPLDVIFDNSTLAGLTAAISTSSDSDGDADTDEGANRQEEILGRLPLAPSQRRFFNRGSTHPEHFNVSVLLEPLSPLDADDFRHALAGLVERHGALRTHFTSSSDSGSDLDTGLSQVVVPYDGQTIPLTHVIVDNTDDFANVVEEQCAELQQSFNLGASPLAAAALFDDNKGRQRAFITVHHLVADRLSLLALIDELDLVLSGQQPAEPTTPFSVWSEAIARFTDSAEGQSALESWKTKVSTTELDLGGEDTPNLNRSADGHRIELDAEISAGLLRGGSGRADEKVLLALADALAAYTGTDEPIGIDVLGHGRRHLNSVNLARTVGFFLSYSPVWLTSDTDSTISARVEDLRNRMIDAWTFDPLRFAFGDKTGDWVQPRVLFNYVGRPVEGASPSKLAVVVEDKGSDTHPDNVRDHDLAVMVEVSNDDQVAITVVYSTSRMPSPDFAKFVSQLETSVKSIAN